MNRLPALLLILLAVPVMAENEQGARVGNPRAYEVDILFDTFGFTQDAIDAEVEQVFQGCPQRDCIPSIDQPQFLKTGQVDFLDEDDIVISLTWSGETRAYPTRILDRHEIVNDNFGNTPIAVTYCPLCGSGLAFIRVLDGEETEFGVSGLLHNNDLIMYDRRTHSIWQQITGRALAGPKRGEALEAVPVGMVEWGDWRESNPAAEVLAPPAGTGSYAKNAYGDYATSDRLLFPVEKQDARLHAKKIIYGVETGSQPIAIESNWLQGQGGWEYEVGGKVLSLRVDRTGGVTGSLAGEPLPVHRMYWFAWYSFHPDTSLIGTQNKQP
jgi:hypothetical protein